MRKKQVIGKMSLSNNTECKIIYINSSDIVEVQLGGTSLRFKGNSFILLNELLRKAAAKVVMQTVLTEQS